MAGNTMRWRTTLGWDSWDSLRGQRQALAQPSRLRMGSGRSRRAGRPGQQGAPPSSSNHPSRPPVQCRHLALQVALPQGHARLLRPLLVPEHLDSHAAALVAGAVHAGVAACRAQGGAEGRGAGRAGGRGLLSAGTVHTAACKPPGAAQHELTSSATTTTTTTTLHPSTPAHLTHTPHTPAPPHKRQPQQHPPFCRSSTSSSSSGQ
jgi:hypothetical protein